MAAPLSREVVGSNGIPGTNANGTSSPNLEYVPGVSPAMRTVERALGNVAASAIPVLIVGESGSGKRTLARRLHELSGCTRLAMEPVNCATISAEAFARELDRGRDGQDESTLFLVEMTDLSAGCQSKLIQYFRSDMASNDHRKLIMTTSHRLEEELAAERLRQDLFYCVTSVSLHVPPLRYRRQDIPVLTDFFLQKYSNLFGRVKVNLSSEARRLLLQHPWPGNVRQLEDAVRTIVAIGNESVALAALRVSSGNLQEDPPESDGVRPLKQAAREASRQAERELILKVLSRTRWNRKRAAEQLQISYKALLYKLKEIGLSDTPASGGIHE